MSVVLDRFGRNGRHIVVVAAWMLAAASPLAAQGRDSGASGAVIITIDQAQVMKMPDGVSTLVVGNQLIADVSIQSGGLVALDRSGAVLEQKTIQVQSARDSVVVYRGVERESYSCTPKCERRITLGDSNDYFAATLGQTGARTGQAPSAAPSK